MDVATGEEESQILTTIFAQITTLIVGIQNLPSHGDVFGISSVNVAILISRTYSVRNRRKNLRLLTIMSVAASITVNSSILTQFYLEILRI